MPKVTSRNLGEGQLLVDFSMHRHKRKPIATMPYDSILWRLLALAEQALSSDKELASEQIDI
uniref:Uncharacterized protein n=1 Tax=Romanomermis culicivorax TaxID=13658 RepID=A0A915ID36_ROMCU